MSQSATFCVLVVNFLFYFFFHIRFVWMGVVKYDLVQDVKAIVMLCWLCHLEIFTEI